MSLPKWTKKLPKKVTICGRKHNIVYNMALGATADTSDQLITIGCQHSREVALELLVHEITELVYWELGYRYSSGNETRFSMSHAEFQNSTIVLVAALIDCGLLK